MSILELRAYQIASATADGVSNSARIASKLPVRNMLELDEQRSLLPYVWNQSSEPLGRCAEEGQKVLDFKCKKTDKSTKKPEIIETQKSLEADMFASQTPAKTNESLNTKFREGEFQLLERYNTIVELFDGMNFSLRLLGLSKKSPTFQNISAQVEVLTERKFSYGHLAQIKYLLPEALQIDRILLHDKKSLCMKPYIKIGLLLDVVEGHDEESDFIALHQIFSSRLVDYFIKHPEACDIPQAILPGPFNQCKGPAFVDKAGDLSEAVFYQSRPYLPAATESQMLCNPSHLHPSFNRKFSQKTRSEEDKTQLLGSPVPPPVSLSGNLNNEHLNEARTGESPELCSQFDGRTNLDIKSEQAKEFCIPYSKSISFNHLPSQPINPEVSADVSTFSSPKCMPDSSVDKLLLETPAQSTPRRAMPSSDDKHKSTAGQSCKPAKRVLNFSYLEGDKGTSEGYEFLNDSITQTLAGSSSLLKKVEGSHGNSSIDQKTCQSDTMHLQMSIHLPDLVSLIHHIFQSVNFSPITREELVHKIILDSLDIIDRREVEEQIGILEKRVPDWICRIPAPSGDVLYKGMKRQSLQLLLKNCANLVGLQQIHAQALAQGPLYTDQPLACKLLNNYAKLGNPQAAHKVFDYIRDPDIVSYTSLVNLYLNTQLPNKASSVFSELINKGLRPDSHSVVGALSACGKNQDLFNGRIVHGMIFKFQLGANAIVGNALIDMYCRNGEIKIAQLVFKQMDIKDVSSWTTLLHGFVLCNDLESARRVFDEMPARNDVAWTAMITGYVRGEMPIWGLEMFKQMKAEGENQPTVITIVAVLSGCADLGALHHGQAIHGYISKVNLDKNVTVSNALMDLYSKGGWYASHGKGNRALEIFYDMLESRVIPNDVTFLLVLSGCSHSGLVVEAKKLFDGMIQHYGFEPKIEHYGCMVDLHCRAGLLEEAKELIDNMPVKPDAVIWRSLLSACMNYRNFDLAEIAGKKIIELEPRDDGAYDCFEIKVAVARSAL
ncbi:unnamed protein product [Dovyalis caffra]|uniref:CDT1 Geminin-binding domain-containing protein n=1 Tax=Dovyalis caffra TaxID=77055 RepID=A0AAV1RRI5_9ROSI|nr:unnamed protein product [Dovyalis caffra]